MDKNQYDAIFQAIEIIAKSIKNNADKTETGRVTAILSDNLYQVQIRGTLYNIKSNFLYSVNERVRVLFPQGNTTDLYLYPNR